MITSLIATLALFQAAPALRTTYIQSLTKPDGTLQIMTAARRLVKPGKPDIWLVGAIHVGTRAYYASIQGLLDAQEAVFYEGVKKDPAATTMVVPKPDPKAPKPVYKILSDALGLDFQLTDIKYDHKGWRNVDLSWAEMDKLNKEVGGGKPTQYDQIRQFLDPKSAQAQMMATMLASATPGMKEALKIMIVKVASGQLPMVLAPATEKVILEARNQAVVDELGRTVDQTDAPKSIAVFYGALHLSDLETSLTGPMGYKPAERKWFVAASADPKKLDEGGKAFLSVFDKKPKN